MSVCSRCSGVGRIPCASCGGSGRHHLGGTCSSCSGGQTICFICNGTGFEAAAKPVSGKARDSSARAKISRADVGGTLGGLCSIAAASLLALEGVNRHLFSVNVGIAVAIAATIVIFVALVFAAKGFVRSRWARTAYAALALGATGFVTFRVGFSHGEWSFVDSMLAFTSSLVLAVMLYFVITLIAAVGSGHE